MKSYSTFRDVPACLTNTIRKVGVMGTYRFGGGGKGEQGRERERERERETSEMRETHSVELTGQRKWVCNKVSENRRKNMEFNEAFVTSKLASCVTLLLQVELCHNLESSPAPPWSLCFHVKRIY
jgi:hypothetical protein